VRLVSTSIGASDGYGLAVKVGAASGFVDVDVGDGFGTEFVGELFAHSVEPVRPISSPSQLADDQRASRADSFFQKLAERAGEFHHAGGAAAGVDGAEDPGVAVIAHDHHSSGSS